jgi:hypothetical protein
MKDQKWSTKKKDMSTACDMVTRYFDKSKGTLGIHEITMTLDGAIDVQRPDWVIALERKFEEQYGEEKGIAITKRVLGALITAGQVVH